MRYLLVAALGAGCGFSVGAGSGAPADARDAPMGSDTALADAPVDMPPDAFIPTNQWTRRKSITIDPTKVASGPHTNFPLLVKLSSDVGLALDASPTGGDIMFVADDGVTRLPYQRQRFVKGTGELIAWVRIPSLSSGAATTIYMYYGNPAAVDQQDPAATWESAYKGVWHLDDLGDSTSNNNAGTAQNGATVSAAGMIGTAATFDGVDDRIRIANSASLDATGSAATFEMWVKFTDPSASRFQLVLTNSNTFGGSTQDGYSWSTQPDGDHYFYPWAGNVNDFQLVSNPFSNNQWTHAAVTFSFATKAVAIYLDGQPTVTTGMTSTLWTQVANPGDWLLGGNPLDAANHFGGQLDELRVSTGVRSAGWILTEYRNQSAPQTFYTLGVATSL